MSIDDVYSICLECARSNGAVWPKGHVATFWAGKCDLCGKETSLCDVSDWNWPYGEKPKTFDIFRRD